MTIRPLRQDTGRRFFFFFIFFREIKTHTYVYARIMRIYMCVIYKKKKKNNKILPKMQQKAVSCSTGARFQSLCRLRFLKNRLDGSGAYARAFYYKQQSNDLHDARERGGRGAGRVPCARARPHPKARVDRRAPVCLHKRIFFRSNAFNLLQCVI